MSTDQPRVIGVGVISLGWMGNLHARSYRAALDHFPDESIRVRMVIAADASLDVAIRAQGVHGFEKVTTDFHDVLADPDVDVVSICAPNYLHREVALAAVAAGKPFWIEKPMGVSLAQSEQIARAAASAGVVTGVGFNYRNAPALVHARDLIAAGSLGRLTNVTVRLLADYSSDPAGAFTWRFERARAGSGVLGDLLSHGFDLGHFLVGRISEVCAETSTFITERPRPAEDAVSHFSSGTGPLATVENEDHAAVLARFDNGVVGVFEASRTAVGPRAEYTVEVYGTAGSIRWDFQRLNELQVCVGRGGGPYGYTTVYAEPGDGDFDRFQPGGGVAMGFDDLKTIEAHLFLVSVLSGEQLAPSVADGWAAAAVVDAAERSVLTRAWVDVANVEGVTTYQRPVWGVR